MKQILHIAPILPGQTPDRRFSIPSRSRNPSLERMPTRHSHKAHEIPHKNPEVMKSEPELPQQPPKQHQQTFGDLIDLSDPVPQPPAARKPNPSNPANPPLAPIHKPKSQPENHVINHQEHAFAKSMPPSKLLNSVEGESGKQHAIRRTDSETHEEDEFHDAHS